MFLSCSPGSRAHYHSICGYVSLILVSPLLTQGLSEDRGPEEAAAIRLGPGVGQRVQRRRAGKGCCQVG